MHKEVRQKKIRLRKNFFPTLVAVILLWGLLASYIYFIGPDSTLAVVGFFLFLFITAVFTFSALFINTRRGILLSLGVTFFLVLRYFGLGNILNLVLLGGIILSYEIYSVRR
jgi:hypothetical protein